MPRVVDPAALKAWDKARPGVRRFLMAMAQVREPAEWTKSSQLTATEIKTLARHAAALAWEIGQLEAMAPLPGFDPMLHRTKRPVDLPYPELFK
jgi:hypothetical protein